MAQTPKTPDVAAQRAAMKKLEFLVGEWSGEASVLRGPGKYVELTQTESAHLKLHGLVLISEGVSKTKADGKLTLQALGIFHSTMKQEPIGCEHSTMDGGLRARSNLLTVNYSISWGFTVGPFKTATVLRINENGEWTERGELFTGD